MNRIFEKETQYSWANAIFICGFVLVMRFLFREEWANSNSFLQFVDKMAKIIPAIRALHEHWRFYTNYWGVFFSLFWVTVPIYWLLGFFGTSKLSAFRYQKFVIETTILRIFCLLLLLTFLIIFAFAFPMLDGMRFINQASNFLPQLLFSWWITGGIFYVHAQVCRVLIIKLEIKRQVDGQDRSSYFK